MKRLLFALTLSISTFYAYAQVQIKDTLSWTEFFEKGSAQYSYIRYDSKIDSNKFNKYSRMPGGDIISWREIQIKDSTKMLKCNNCTIKNLPVIQKSNLGPIAFVDCTIECDIKIDSSILTDIHIGRTILKGNILISNSIANTDCGIWINKSELKTINVINSTITSQSKEINYYCFATSINASINIHESICNELHMDSVKIQEINPKRKKYDLSIRDLNCKSLHLANIECNIFSFTKSTATRGIFAKKLNIKDNIDIFESDFNAQNTLLDWQYLAGKLCLFESKEPSIYTGQSLAEMGDKINYNSLLAIYNKLFLHYKVRADRESANACYREMKDLETRRARYLWEQDRSLGAWFDWRLNQFLKYFCDYGTSPVKALIRSMWTILLFALLYFFFYSDWDRINRGFLIRQHRRLLRYFRSEIRLEELYHEGYEEEYRSYEDYRRELEESRVEVPYYIHLLGRPLYHLSLLRHRAMGAVYRKLEVLGGVWKELPPRRQWVTGTLVGVAVGGYLVHLALVRTLNSVMLSINTFSTLGFGDIPVRGWIRYAAILEGFLGWFLLSIFSVSLISQILQV